jgi:peptide/nickel transport system substrate-binding protein
VLSRRHFLTSLSGFAPLAILAACGSPPATPTSAPAATPAPKPAATTAPTSAPTAAQKPAPTAAPTIVPAATAGPTTAAAAPSALIMLPPIPSPAPSNAKKADKQVLQLGNSIAVLSGIFPAGFASAERIVMSNVYLPPFIRDDKHELHPGLLTGYQANADFTTYTLKVDPKAKWSDGSPLTAKDIKAGWEANMAPVPEGIKLQKFFQFIRTGMDPIDGIDDLATGKTKELASIKVVDDQTLTVHLNRSEPNFPQRLALPNMAIMKVDQWAADPFVFEKPEVLVNGPFKVATYDKQANDYVFVRNPNWWGKQPIIEQIEFKASVDESTEYALWQNNQIDVGFWTGDVLKQLFASDGDTISRLPYPGVGLGILFNTGKEPLSDLNVRMALASGADYNGIVMGVAGDTQAPALGVIPPELPCYTERKSTYQFDVAAAQQFLSKSKYGSADNVPKIEFGNSIKAPWPELQAVIEQWRTNLGLRIDYITDTSFPGNKDAHIYDVVRWSQGSIIPDTIAFLQSALNPSDGVFKYQSGYDSPRIRQALGDAAKLPVDDPKRCQLAQQAQEQWMSDVAGVPIERVAYEYWVKPRVVGWKNNIDLSPYTITDMFIAEQ